MKIEMNKEILDVILAVLAYKKFICSHDNVIPEEKFNWYDKTEEYYYSLPLPDGMHKNIADFENVLNYGDGHGKELLEIMYRTDFEKLNKYNWRN